MNDKQRKVISKSLDAVNIALKALESATDTFQSDLTAEADEERNKFDNMSEGLQQSDTGQKLEESADGLEEAQQDAESLLDDIRQLIERGEELKSKVEDTTNA